MVEQNKMAGPLVVLKYYQLSDFMIADFSWSTIKPARLSGFMASQVKKNGWYYGLAGFIASWVKNLLLLWLSRKNWPIVQSCGQPGTKLAGFMASLVKIGWIYGQLGKKLAGFIVQLKK